MTVFEPAYFESSPPEGLYNVDVGLSELNDFGHLQTFADMNSDKYTDMVTVNGGNQVFIHVYDTLTKMFTPWKDFTVDGCSEIRNIVVGRSSQTMRLFVTCSTSFGGTAIKIVDRVTKKQSTSAEDIT